MFITRMFINDENNNSIESFNNELAVTATRELNSKMITCMAENSIGLTVSNKTLNIICKLIK
jgi:hypothetical protein